jgi:two-component system, OmpR family, phosphate regulon response regulator PhoB
MTAPLGLVVDDDSVVRSFFAKVLRRNGMEIREASSGWEALLMAYTTSPAFVVTDLQMPDLDGLELCRRLRRTPTTAKLLIVVVSAGAVTQRDQAIAAGCDVVLEKPCSPALLVTTIQRLLVKRFPSSRTH